MNTDAPNTITQAVLQGEDARRQALVANDVDALRTLLADDLVYVHSTGGRDTRDSYIAKLQGGALRYLEVAFTDLQVSPRPQAAVVTGRMSAVILKDGERKSVSSLFMTVWMPNAQGRWQLRAHQGTPVAAA